MLKPPTALQTPIRSSIVWLIATFVCLLSTGAASADELNPSEAVSLDRTTEFRAQIYGMSPESIWHRELMRQALLVAARSEMNLPISDAVLGEYIAPGNVRSLELVCRPQRKNYLELRQGAYGKRVAVWSQEFDDFTEWPPHRHWLEQMETFSRGGFVEALEKAGHVRQKRIKSKNAAAPLDEELAARIDRQLTFESQFLAIRQLHAAIAEDGETRARLGGLVRAYANLGLLTEQQWHPMSYAFKARAALYAQRWVVRDAKSSVALQHRAYAFALVGMHADALRELKAAEKVAEQFKVKAEVPEWVPLLDAYCHYDAAKIAELRKDEALTPLATLLGYLCQEHEGSNGPTVVAGMDALKDLPGCNRILDTLCMFTGPGLGHATTQLGPLHLATSLLPGLAKEESLPPHVKKALVEARDDGVGNEDAAGLEAEAKHRLLVMTALRRPAPLDDETKTAAVDNNGLSWPVLAQIIEETTFLHVYRRGYFVAQMIGVSADGELQLYDPILANHRLAPFLNQFRSQRDSDLLAAAQRDLDKSDLDFVQASLWSRWEGRDFYYAAHEHMAALPNEWSLAGRVYPASVSHTARSSLAVSPHSTYAMAIPLKVLHGMGDPEPAWEAAAEKSPHLAKELAQFWTKQNNPEKAEKFLVLATKLDPSAENCRLLAAIYKGRGDDEKWLEALEMFLKTPSLSLEHAEVQCEIATYYAERREWDKALPYTDEAAQTGAQWAMSWSRTANEINQNWDVAEKLHVAAAARYGEHPVIWYFFCQRNGCGHLEVARKAAFPEGVEALVDNAPFPPNYLALALQLEGHPERALAVLEGENQKAPNSWDAMRAAILADQINDDAKRDECLKLVIEQKEVPSEDEPRPRREELVGLARHLQKDIAAGGKGDLNLEEIHTLRDAAPERDRCTFNYLLGCYLDKRGKRDEAIEYWKLCMGAQDLVMSTRTAAGFALHNHGVKPEDWKQLLFAKPDALQAVDVPTP